MTNIHVLPDRLDPIDEASKWIAKLDRHEEDMDETALREWLVADPQNVEALMEVARLWDRMDALSRLADLFPQASAPRRHIGPDSYAFAAALLMAFSLGLWFTFGNSWLRSRPTSPIALSEPEQIFQTAIGGHSTVNLSDGSQLYLNTNSLVRVMFTESRRVLRLDRGEMYVRAVHNELRPLRVYVGGKVVEDVGTEFDVEITQDNKVQVIVTKGKVTVGIMDKKPTVASSEGPIQVLQSSSVAVSAGEKVLLGDSAEKVVPIKPQDIAVKLSWRGGKLVFRGESLQEVLSEIERYTPVEFVIQDENLKSVRIVGMFKTGDVEGLLSTLRQNFDITYQRVGDDKVILTNKSDENN